MCSGFQCVGRGSNMSLFHSLLIALVVVSTTTTPAWAQSTLVDDFNDGVPDGWTPTV